MALLKISREDWLTLGHRLFAEKGEHGIVVDAMARELNCNKSSFYWRFKNKNKFIIELARDWVIKETKDVIFMIETKKSTKDKFQILVALSFRKKPHLDFVFYLKRYSLFDENIRNMLKEIDALRKNVVYSLLQDLGYNKEESKLRTALFYKFLIGYHETIRYKNQYEDYVEKVMIEINLFIKME